MDYKLKWPNVKGRKRINTDDINYGDVVAVAEVYTNTFTECDTEWTCRESRTFGRR